MEDAGCLQRFGSVVTMSRYERLTMKIDRQIAILESQHDYELASAVDVYGKVSPHLQTMTTFINSDAELGLIEKMTLTELKVLWMSARIGYRQILISTAKKNQPYYEEHDRDSPE